jgi:oxygen-independent coproporphyrinogen-3 oxidase
MAPYVGLGPAAHSFIEPARYWNLRSVAEYIQRLEAGELPLDEKERLTREQLLMEAIYLNFRTAQGIELSGLKSRFGMDFVKHFGRIIADFETEGFLEVTQTHCALTVKGMALLDSITTAFTSQDLS